MPFREVERGGDFAVASWGDLVVCSCYLSPARSVAEAERYFDVLSGVVHRYRQDPLLVCGDFNARVSATRVRPTRGEPCPGLDSGARLSSVEQGLHPDVRPPTGDVGS